MSSVILEGIAARLQQQAQQDVDEQFRTAFAAIRNGVSLIAKDWEQSSTIATKVIDDLRAEHGEAILARAQKKLLDKTYGGLEE